ncbi:uncharacterized protein [Clytia hemisphaerica]|uniref:uncharacterized protein n=1 Tax=Clytia hemisphaerica TaxID=252671 RepID=UPI0034D5A274
MLLQEQECNVRLTKAKIISGNKACGERCTVDYSTDYSGCNIRTTSEGSWQECAKKCSKFKGCNYWTWEHRLSVRLPLRCQLKGRQCNIKVGDPSVISGNRTCAVADD